MTPPLDTPSLSGYPNRKTIREWFHAQRERRNIWALILLSFDLTVFFSCLAFIVSSQLLLLKIGAGIVAGVFIARLFVLGHDACHGSLTSSRMLNKIIGRIAFAPSLMPYTHWEVSHNSLHHVYTNLKGRDQSWDPFSKADYDKLPKYRQWLERLYRSPIGAGPYYLIDMWWGKYYAPSTSNRRAAADKNFITLVLLAWLGGLAWCAWHFDTGIVAALVCGFLIPFVVWGYGMGFIIYVHHTHPNIYWYEDMEEWSKSTIYLSATIHIELPMAFGPLFHNINEHPAHHTDMGIPSYCLKQAQQVLEQQLPGKILIERFSWAYYRDVTRRCKLYDFKNKQWLDFAGNVSS